VKLSKILVTGSTLASKGHYEICVPTRSGFVCGRVLWFVWKWLGWLVRRK